MKIKWIVIVSVLLLISLACGVATPTVTAPAEPTVEIEPPVEATTEISAPTEETVAPTEGPTATETPPEPLRPVLYYQYNTDPSLVTVIDATSGAVIRTFDAPTISWLSEGAVGGESIFYITSNGTSLFRVGFDGTVQDLAFTHPNPGFLNAAILPSPDGQKIAWGSVLNMDTTGTDILLKVANIDGSNMVTLLDGHMTESRRPSPIKFSNDGQFLYYTNMPYGIGGYILFYGGPDLVRINMTTLVAETILPSNNCLCAMEFSPDESKVARINRTAEGLSLVVHEISSGTETTFPFPSQYTQAGGIIWSPDGGSIMLTLALGNPDTEAFSVVKIDLVTSMVSYFLSNDTRCIQTREWVAPGVVWLSDTEYNVYRMDSATGALTLHASDGYVISNSD
jgi:hypothetical protein